jgi:AmmeMemoRadiSam system protein B/AmmeMemoRadiSam system protein A
MGSEVTMHDRRVALILALLLAGRCLAEEPEQRVIRPAVAGAFYPAEADELGSMVDGFLAKAPAPSINRIRGLVSPHAGYIFSGPIAAYGYRQLQGQDISTVIVLGPSHRHQFEGASIPDATHMKTPLGLVEISPKAQQLLAQDLFIDDPEAYRREHSVETQLPFVQRVLPQAQVVPIVVGAVDPVALAAGLRPVLDEHTLVIASSDLSHFLPYDDACKLDRFYVRAIELLDPALFRLFSPRVRPCGRVGVAVLARLARELGWQARALDYRNSGDTQGQRDQGVVGYTSIAFFEPEEGSAPPPQPYGPLPLEPAQRQQLLQLARRSIAARLDGEELAAPDPATLPEPLRQHRGVFVTLQKEGKLRGCIGSLAPLDPVWQGVMDRAVAAAFHDRRFEPLDAGELDAVHIEISVLTLPELLAYDTPEDLLAKLVPGRDGVILMIGNNQATYLPTVWEQLPDPEEFLSRLSRKAGLSVDGWRRPYAQVFTYQAQVFGEREVRER